MKQHSEKGTLKIHKYFYISCLSLSSINLYIANMLQKLRWMLPEDVHLVNAKSQLFLYTDMQFIVIESYYVMKCTRNTGPNIELLESRLSLGR